MAARACEIGRVESHGQPVKPARLVKVGDFYRVTTEGGIFEVEVLVLSEVRGPAPVAHTLYRETEEGREAREYAAAQRKAMMQYAPAPEGRPTKQQRRKIIQFRKNIV